MRALILGLAVLVFSGLVFSGAAHAHQMKAALTEMYLNPRTGQLEVAHRFYIHDAEKGLAEMHGLRLDLINSAQARATFSDYVADSFQLRDAETKAPIEFALLGSEIERGFIWVYQEAPAQSLPGDIDLSHTGLRDVWHDQVNTVNLIQGDQIETLTFTGADQFKPVTLSTG